jgi:intracellular sulfur oxidation DsrE/DsrF family protein
MPTQISDTVILVTRNGMGQAEPALQQKLITTFLKLLNEDHVLPAVICFYTEGVHLVVSGSPILATLHALEDKGVRLILCSTCLNFYNLIDQVQVGVVGGMGDILEAMNRAGKVITL